MGQSQSSLDGAHLSAIDDDIQILGYQPCVHDLVPGHTRALPPPQHRSSVLVDLQRIQRPNKTPKGTESGERSNLKRSSLSVERDSEHNSLGEGSCSSFHSRQDTKPPIAQNTSPMKASYDSHSRKKRRLFKNGEAVELAQKISDQHIHHDDETSSSTTLEGDSPESGISKEDNQQADAASTHNEQIDDAQNDGPLRTIGPFPLDDSEDEGYFTHSHTSADISLPDEDEDGLVKQLANLHSRSVVSRPNENKTHIPPALDSPTLRKLREEDEAAEQSRLLREKKLLETRSHKISAVNRGSNHNEKLPTNSPDAFDEENIVDDLYFYTKPVSSPSSSHSAILRRTPTFPSRNASCQPRTHAVVLSEDDNDHFEIDDLLDITQNYSRKGTPLPKPRLRRINPMTPQYRRFPTRPHAASRMAAEQYRTQNRHLSSFTNGNVSSGPIKASAEAEDRLRTLTAKKPHKYSAASIRPQVDRFTSSPPQVIRKSYGIDPRSSKPKRHWKSRSPSPYIMPYDAETGSSLKGAASTESSAVGGSAELQTLEASRPRSILEMMAQRAEARQQHSGESVNLPPEASLTLGMKAEIDSEDEDEVRKEHERLKEQQRDLQAIESTCKAIAKIRAIGPLTVVESKEEQELRKFASIVLDTNRSGKDRRPRMTHIRGNFAKRLEKEHMIASKDRIQEEYVMLLGEKRVKLLDDLREPLDDLVNEFRAKRSAVVSRRRNLGKQHKRRKQVRFAPSMVDKTTGRVRRDLPDGMEIDFDEHKAKVRVTPRSKEEEEIAMLSEKLRRFETQKNAMVQHTTSTNQPLQPTDSESEESEEEEGAEYVFGAGRDLSANSNFTASTSYPSLRNGQQLEVEQEVEEINRLEDQRQRGGDSLTVSRSANHHSELGGAQHGFQRPDLELIENMKRNMITRYRNGDVQGHLSTDESPFDDIAEDSDSGASLALSESSTSTSSSDQPKVIQRFKYTVMGQFVGIDIYNPEELYTFKTFHDLHRANDHVQQVLTSLAANHKHICSQDWELQTRRRNDMFEQVLSLGKEDLVQAKVWVERELIDVELGKIASAKARKAILSEDRGVWVVHWEKMVTTTFAVDAPAVTETATSPADITKTLEAGIEEDEDDLFGRSPSPPPPPTTRITTTTSKSTSTSTAPSTDLHTRTFTTPALANRHAKNLYITWYAPFFPPNERPYYGRYLPASGCPYEGALKQVEQALEQELERLGDFGLGGWEEEVELPVHDHDQDDDENESGWYGEGDLNGNCKGKGKADGDGQGEGKKVLSIKEKMKVWVQRVGVLGPAN